MGIFGGPEKDQRFWGFFGGSSLHFGGRSLWCWGGGWGPLVRPHGIQLGFSFLFVLLGSEQFTSSSVLTINCFSSQIHESEVHIPNFAATSYTVFGLCFLSNLFCLLCSNFSQLMYPMANTLLKSSSLPSLFSISSAHCGNLVEGYGVAATDWYTKSGVISSTMLASVS